MVHEVGTGADEKTAELPAHNCGAPESPSLGNGGNGQVPQLQNVQTVVAAVSPLDL